MKSLWPSSILLLCAMGAAVTIAEAQPAAGPAPAQTPPTQTPPAQTPPPQAGPRPGPQYQWPETIRNAKVLPKNIGSERLRNIMRGFAISLGVRCTYCHTGTEQMSLAERDFSSDDNPRKNAARAMMRMVDRLNAKDLPAIAGKGAHVTCYSCHRGEKEPATIPPAPPAPPPARTPAS